jgi:ABC-type Na+ transport system ATPase subunit NatA
MKYGELYAVKSLELDLKKGDVFGFIGPNGAGKTTTMRILATLLNPTWGEAYVCGYSIYTRSQDIRRIVGYMPDFFGVYDDMKVIEYLEFFAAAYRIKGAARRKVCDEVLDLVDLGYKREALVTSLSRGMTQRLGLARVLLHDPQVLLLDEPASGLDPRARIEIRGLLKELRNLGKTIMVSSHILPELADICNKIGIIERGEQQSIQSNRFELGACIVGFLEPVRVSRKCLNDFPSCPARHGQVARLLPLGNQCLPRLDDATDASEKGVPRKALQVVGSRRRRGRTDSEEVLQHPLTAEHGRGAGCIRRDGQHTALP